MSEPERAGALVRDVLEALVERPEGDLQAVRADAGRASGYAAPAATPPEERPQTMGEEVANAVTHGVGALLALACFVVAVAFAALRGDAWRIVSVSIYGLMMFTLYLSSTLYHAAHTPRVKAVLNLVDHASIYLMIAGCYTPFCLVPLRQYSPGWGWGILGTIWLLALLGVVFQCCFINRYQALSTLTYVLMGWLVVVAVYPLWRAMGTTAVLWIAAGGVAYTLGVVFYAWKGLKYAHAVWHLFVLGGTMVHFFTILFFVVLP